MGSSDVISCGSEISDKQQNLSHFVTPKINIFWKVDILLHDYNKPSVSFRKFELLCNNQFYSQYQRFLVGAAVFQLAVIGWLSVYQQIEDGRGFQSSPEV